MDIVSLTKPAGRNPHMYKSTAPGNNDSLHILYHHSFSFHSPLINDEQYKFY
jgi:hypothetical protein